MRRSSHVQNVARDLCAVIISPNTSKLTPIKTQRSNSTSNKGVIPVSLEAGDQQVNVVMAPDEGTSGEIDASLVAMATIDGMPGVKIRGMSSDGT